MRVDVCLSTLFVAEHNVINFFFTNMGRLLLHELINFLRCSMGGKTHCKSGTISPKDF